MPKMKIIGGIDIGSYAVKTLIVQKEEGKNPKIIGLGYSPAHGIREGIVKDFDEAVKSISASVNEAEMAGVSLTRFNLALNGEHIKARISRGFVSVSRADQEISDSDIARVADINHLKASQPNREPFHIIPLSFTIDGQEIVQNPLGMKGFKLESDVLVIDGLTMFAKNLEKCLTHAGIEIGQRIFSPLAASIAVLEKKEREYGALMLDFGSELSSISLFNGGSLIYSSTLPLGSWYITHDINIAFRIPVDNAEQVKREFGYVESEKGGGYKRDQIDLSSITGVDKLSVSRRKLGDVINSRVREWINLVNRSYRKVNMGELPTVAVLVGGGMNLRGIGGFIKDQLGLPVRSGYPLNLDSVSEDAEDPAFAVAAGLCLWGLEMGEGDSSSSLKVDFSQLKGLAKWFKNFIP